MTNCETEVENVNLKPTREGAAIAWNFGHGCDHSDNEPQAEVPELCAAGHSDHRG